MLYLVYGAGSSGKSAYAEELAVSLSDNRYYLATMKSSTDEDRKRVEKHRRMRVGRNFTTIEMPTDICRAPDMVKPDARKRVFLLECMSNLTANEMFVMEDGCCRVVPGKQVSWKIIEDIKKLAEDKRVNDLVIVSNNVFDEGTEYNDVTLEYMRALGDINIAIADMADKVIEVVCGIPVKIKE